MDEVLIIGAGPTGLAAALFLTERGVPVRVVEQHEGLSRHSKAFGVNPRTLALLEPTGVTERLLAQGHRMVAANLHRHGRHRFRLDLTKAHHRFPFMLIHSQAKSEEALADALAGRGVGVEFNTRLTDLRADPDAVRARLELPNGRAEEVTSRFALAADGPHSTARERLRVGFPGSGYPEPWKIIDLHLGTPLAPDQAHLFLHDEGAMFLIRLEGDVWRVGGNVLPLLDRLPPGTVAGEVVWDSDFIIRHCITERFRVGGVAFAGDAAHIHSPLGARGMNLGIEDAYVFASLLAEGRLPEYERLRRPAVTGVVRRVGRMTSVARGKSWTARLARWGTPLLGGLLALTQGGLRDWVLGLDHEVRRGAASPRSTGPGPAAGSQPPDRSGRSRGRRETDNGN